jgi:hypothetical protein
MLNIHWERIIMRNFTKRITLIFVLSAFIFIATSGWASTTPSITIAIETLEKIADAHAFELWGDNVGRGKPIPLYDAGGSVFAYLFPYIRGSKQFPGFDRVFGDIRSLRTRFRAPTEPGQQGSEVYFSALRILGEGYGAICVSANRNGPPVLWASHFLPEYFIIADTARVAAQRRLGRADAAFSRYYYINHDEQYLEFSAAGKQTLVDLVKIDKSIAADALTRRARVANSPEFQKIIDQSWDRLTSGGVIRRGPTERAGDPIPLPKTRIALPPGKAVAPLGIAPNDISHTHTVKKIAYWELIPIVQHTPKHWCVIASKAMVLGFYDNYVPGKGTLTGFGRFIDYWYEMTPGSYNQPNLVDQCLPGKDPAKDNGYNCIWTETPASKSNDYAWATLKAEIDAGRPCFFSIVGHTTAAFGYRVDANGDKFAIVYDPPNPSTPTYVKEYNYLNCIQIGAVIPTQGTGGDHLVLIAPDGAENFYTNVPNEVSWFVWGTKITKTNLWISQDGGNTWALRADNLPTKGAWNSFAWFPTSVSTKTRLRVNGVTAANELIAAAGSFHNFDVKPSAVGSGWKQIWGPTGIVLARYVAAKNATVVYATQLSTGNIYRYDGVPGKWTKVGGPGKMFALDGTGQLYGISADGKGVMRYDGTPLKWTQVGGPAATIYAGGSSLFATNPTTGDIMAYNSPWSWTRIGGPGKAFAVDSKGHLYGVSPDPKIGVMRYDGTPGHWTRVSGPVGAIYAGGSGLWATLQGSGNIFTYNLAPMSWTQVGGPGKMHTVDDSGRMYGLSVDGNAVFRYDGGTGTPWKWTKVGGSAGKIFAGGYGRLFATNPTTGDLWSLE